MNPKFILYLFVVPFIMFLMESINIDGIFKKNRVLQIKLLYLVTSFGLSYLFVNFIYDVVFYSKLV